MKTKMREKVRPKMGRIDIDYQKLHDAFFRWQTQPRMSILGDLYFEVCTIQTLEAGSFHMKSIRVIPHEIDKGHST